ncbi:YncE family protein [Candidatus Woesearchaeota archaeon]|nr:YncE family protein [Candidatus Woesearchaeota archaeon]
MMKKNQISVLLLVFFVAFSINVFAAMEEEKLYVAIEGEGKIAVFDTATRSLLRHIDLAYERHGMVMSVSPHNIQVAPDGKTVWVTANGSHGDHGGKPAATGHEEDGDGPHGRVMEAPTDEVLVIDPETDAIIRRIPIGQALHLAHVVLTPDSSTAYVTAQNENAIYTLDARHYTVTGKIQAPTGSQPHGLRVAPDGSKAYIALLQGKGMGILDLVSGKWETLPLEGAAVQTAVTPDGKLALASLYDTKKLAVYNTASKTLHYIDLLKPARGPVQLYPSPDSRYVYVADQGHYFGQPNSQWLFKVDLAKSTVVWSLKAGTAPHGIVIAKDGAHAYVTNLVSDDLSVMDLNTDTEIARISVGREPNGISLWNRHSGGTP